MSPSPVRFYPGASTSLIEAPVANNDDAPRRRDVGVGALSSASFHDPKAAGQWPDQFKDVNGQRNAADCGGLARPEITREW